MANYLDSKIDELVDLSMRMKRGFVGEHFKSKVKEDLKLRWKMEVKLKMKAKLKAKVGFQEGNQESRSSLQTEALLFITRNTNCSMKDLADNLGISMSSATQLVERLVLDNLIVRVDDEIDRRIIRLKITDKGKDELDNCMFFIKQKIKFLYKNLTDKDIDDFIRVANKILNNLNSENI